MPSSHQMQILLLPLLLTISFVSFLPANVSALGIVDQQCLSTGAVGPDMPAGQTFTPTKNAVEAFSINVYSTNTVNTSMTARILVGGLGGSTVGSVNFSIPASFGLPSGNWLNVNFSGRIWVKPGSFYALDLRDNLGSTGIKWDRCTDSYTGGSGYSNGQPLVNGGSYSFIIYDGNYLVSALPDKLTLAQGSSGLARINVNASNAFGSPVNLAATGAPTGVMVSFTANTLGTTPGGSATSALNIQVGASVPLGTYQLNITASSGTESHSAALFLNVIPSQSGVPLLAAIAVLLAVGVVGSLAVFSRKSGKPPAFLTKIASQVRRSKPAAPQPSLPEGSVPPGQKSASVKTPSTKLPKALTEHLLPVSMVAAGLGLVVAGIKITFGDPIATLVGLLVPGILLLAIGSAILFLQLYHRPVGVRRFCMHCGFQMSSVDSVCGRCHRQPPSGIDTRVCPNCSSVVPALAKFCKDCGAGQPASA